MRQTQGKGEPIILAKMRGRLTGVVPGRKYKPRDSFHIRKKAGKKERPGPERETVIRPPAVYENRTREDLFSQYENIKI